MAKMTAALILVFCIELSLVLFGGFGGVDESNTMLYNALVSPSGLTATTFYGVMLLILSVAALSYITPGTFVQANQWALFAGAGVALITFAINISHLWNFLSGQLGSILDVTAGNVIATMITAPLLIFYLVTVAEWSRNN